MASYSEEARQAAEVACGEFYKYTSRGHFLDVCARAIDDAFRRGQVAEREECAKLADIRATEDFAHAKTTNDDVGYVREATALCAEDIADAIRARRTP